MGGVVNPVYKGTGVNDWAFIHQHVFQDLLFGRLASLCRRGGDWKQWQTLFSRGG